MNVLHKIKRYMIDPGYRFEVNARHGLHNRMPDEKYTELQYFARTGRKLNLSNPERFNEKLQWLKLYYRKPEFTAMVDKYAVKAYVAEKIGEKHVVPLLGVWDRFDQIDFDALPNQFVLKTTHGSGGLVVCREKAKLDLPRMKKKFEAALRTNYYYSCREWPYKNVKPRIIAEQYMQDGDNENLVVYKVFNFSGKPAIIQTIQNDKQPNETIDYFDTDWNLLELRQNFPNSEHPMTKPKTLETILRLSAICSEGFPFLRTDWYEVNGEVYFSEFTFFSDAGTESFTPDSWDMKLGAMIELPKEKCLAD